MHWLRWLWTLLSQVIAIAITLSISAVALYATTIFLIAMFIILEILVPLLLTSIPAPCKLYLLLHVFTTTYVVIQVVRSTILALATLAIIQWSIIVVAEVIVDEIYSFAHWFDSAPPVGTMQGKWELVTTTRSSNNGYESEQFYPATICDSNQLDDPFWPDHASIIHSVEIRRRSMLWKDLTIWQVSMVNGGQKKLHEMRMLGRIDVPFQRRFDAGPVPCFQSANIIFIAYRSLSITVPVVVLHVFDMRFKESKIYDLPQMTIAEKLISVTCMERLVDSAGALEGWRIRLIHANVQIEDQDDENLEEPPWHAKMGTTIIELRQEASLVSRKLVIFGNFGSAPRLRAVRTSDGMFGVYAEDEIAEDGPAILFDESCSVYVFCANIQELLQLDERFRGFAAVAGDLLQDGDLCPTLLNQRECIEGFSDGSIYRVQLAPPSLKYLATKCIFQSSPGLRNRTTADQFRQLTGVLGMEAHFG